MKESRKQSNLSRLLADDDLLANRLNIELHQIKEFQFTSCQSLNEKNIKSQSNKDPSSSTNIFMIPKEDPQPVRNTEKNEGSTLKSSSSIKIRDSKPDSPVTDSPEASPESKNSPSGPSLPEDSEKTDPFDPSTPSNTIRPILILNKAKSEFNRPSKSTKNSKTGQSGPVGLPQMKSRSFTDMSFQLSDLSSAILKRKIVKAYSCEWRENGLGVEETSGGVDCPAVDVGENTKTNKTKVDLGRLTRSLTTAYRSVCFFHIANH